jgi:hypothetical protein
MTSTKTTNPISNTLQEYFENKLVKKRKEVLDAKDTLAAALEGIPEENRKKILEAAEVILDMAVETEAMMDDLKGKYYKVVQENNRVHWVRWGYNWGRHLAYWVWKLLTGRSAR